MKVGDIVRVVNGKSGFYDFVGPIDTIVEGAILPYHVILSGRTPLGGRVDGPVYFTADELELADPPKCEACHDEGIVNGDFCDCETGHEAEKAYATRTRESVSTREFLDSAQIVGHLFDGKD